MNLLSNNSAFMIMFLVGAVVVAINATTQFREPVSYSRPGTHNSLLNGLPMRILTGKRSHSLGFAFYLIVFEVVYLLLSTSTVILLAFMQFTGNTGSIGALAIDQNEINPYVPIIASSIVVGLSQLKPFSEVELFLRRASHRFIIRSVDIDAIVSKISNFELPALQTNTGAPKKSTVPIQPSIEIQKWTVEQTRNFNKILSDIEILDAWTDGDQSHIFRALGSVEPIARIKAQVDASIDTFYDRLLRAAGNKETDVNQNNKLKRPQKPVFKATEFWAVAISEARDVKHKLSELLALYLINLPNAGQSIRDEDTREFFDTVQNPKRTVGEISTIATATTLGAAVCLVLFFAYHLTTNAVLDLASSWFSIAEPSSQYLQSFQDVSSLNTAEITHSIDVKYYFSSVASKSIASAFWDVCTYGAIFLVAAALAVAARRPRPPPKDWVSWSRGHHPFWQYVSVGAVASVLSLLVYTILLFVRLVALPSLTLDNTVLSVTLLADFKNYLEMSSGFPLMAFAIAIGICFIYDMLSSENNRDVDSAPGSARIYNMVKVQDDQPRYGGALLVHFPYIRQCKVFTGFLKSRNSESKNIGPALLAFSVAVASINVIVMLFAGGPISLGQLINAIFIPGVSFFVIASIYFELLSINPDAAGSNSDNSSARGKGKNETDSTSKKHAKSDEEKIE